MRYVARVNGRERVVRVEKRDRFTIDDTSREVAVEIIDKRVGAGALLCLFVNGEPHEVFAERRGDRYLITIAEKRYEVQVEDERLRDAGQPRDGEADIGVDVAPDVGETTMISPMAGVVLDVLVEEGEGVQAGDRVVILEAMKMENEIRAPCAGIVERIHVVAGQTVNLKDLIASIGTLSDEGAPKRGT